MSSADDHKDMVGCEEEVVRFSVAEVIKGQSFEGWHHRFSMHQAPNQELIAPGSDARIIDLRADGFRLAHGDAQDAADDGSYRSNAGR